MGSSKYWSETLFHSSALNMWWKENLRVSRETFNSFAIQHDNSESVTSAIADERPLVGYSEIWFFPFSARVVVKGNPQEILLFSCGFQSPGKNRSHLQIWVPLEKLSTSQVSLGQNPVVWPQLLVVPALLAEHNRTKFQSNTDRSIDFDWARQSKLIERQLFGEFDYRT